MQEMESLADFIKNNFSTINTLLKAGVISPSTIANYNIFVFYKGLGNMPIMEKYTVTAKAMRVSEGTVRKSVRDMQRKMIKP